MGYKETEGRYVDFETRGEQIRVYLNGYEIDERGIYPDIGPAYWLDEDGNETEPVKRPRDWATIEDKTLDRFDWAQKQSECEPVFPAEFESLIFDY